MAFTSNQQKRYRYLVEKAKWILGLVLLVLEILDKLLDLLK